MNERHIPEKNGPERIVYRGKILEVVQQPIKIGDKDMIFESARRSPGIRLIIKRGNQMLLTKEFRSELNDWDFRLPGGKVFNTLEQYNAFLATGKDIQHPAQEAAIREAQEEAAIIPISIEFFAESKSGATITWDLLYFIVTDFEELSEQTLELGESITFDWYDIDEVKRMCLDGRIREDRTVAKLLQFINRLKNGS